MAFSAILNKSARRNIRDLRCKITKHRHESFEYWTAVNVTRHEEDGQLSRYIGHAKYRRVKCVKCGEGWQELVWP